MASGACPRAPQRAIRADRHTCRTLKSAVRAELTIPAQTRFLVPVALGRVERQVYDGEFERALDELGLDARGVAARPGWEVDATVLRNAVRTLRGITTHPQVGALVDRTERVLAKAGVLKSIEDVLADMVASNSRAVLEDRKHLAEAIVAHARLVQRDERSSGRYRDALALLAQAEDVALTLAGDVERELVAHLRKGDALRDGDAEAGDDERSGIARTPAGEAFLAAQRALAARLREVRVLQHKVKFVQGDALHVLGLVDEERAAYAAAERLRNVDILSGWSHTLHHVPRSYIL
jgi:E3 ubiquitin-protein ligase SHPRH